MFYEKYSDLQFLMHLPLYQQFSSEFHHQPELPHPVRNQKQFSSKLNHQPVLPYLGEEWFIAHKRATPVN